VSDNHGAPPDPGGRFLQFNQIRDLLAELLRVLPQRPTPCLPEWRRNSSGSPHERGHLSALRMHSLLDGNVCLLRQCHRFTAMRRIDFLELGLSADSSYGEADTRSLRNPVPHHSDAHSPYPDKLGREFNRIRLEHLTAKDVLSQ